MALIKGGFYLKARCVQSSDIAHAPPHVREIWDFLLKEANHEDVDKFKRGTCLRTYKDIQEGLHWYIGWRKASYSKDDCETAMKWLRKRTMVTTRKTTRGMLITIINYDKFQTVSNYENHTRDHRRTTHEPQSRHTINKNDKNDKNEITIPPTPQREEISFDHFWSNYPRKIARRKTETIWKRLKLDNEAIQKIINHIEAMKLTDQWKQKDGQFIPHPATYLNQERWKDEAPKAKIHVLSLDNL